MTIRASRPLVGLTLILFAGLGQGCKPDYPNCKTDDHCAEEGEVCVFGQCQECATDEHCAEGKICRDNRCEAKPECQTDADCDSPLVCKAEKCVPECGSDADCSAGERCEGQRCVPDVECQADSDCPVGERCEGNACVADVECRADADCGPDQQCVDGSCERKQVVEPACELPPRIHFEFNAYRLTPEAREKLEQVAQCLRSRQKLRVQIEGHCDERGTIEYNLALGERRASTVKRYLTSLGVEPERISTVSYGEEKPLDSGHNERAWSKNRRAEFVER